MAEEGADINWEPRGAVLGMDRRLLGRQWQEGWRCDLGRVAARNQNLCEEEIIRMLCSRRRLATEDSQKL